MSPSTGRPPAGRNQNCAGLGEGRPERFIWSIHTAPRGEPYTSQAIIWPSRSLKTRGGPRARQVAIRLAAAQGPQHWRWQGRARWLCPPTQGLRGALEARSGDFKEPKLEAEPGEPSVALLKIFCAAAREARGEPDCYMARDFKALRRSSGTSRGAAKGGAHGRARRLENGQAPWPGLGVISIQVTTVMSESQRTSRHAKATSKQTSRHLCMGRGQAA